MSNQRRRMVRRAFRMTSSKMSMPRMLTHLPGPSDGAICYAGCYDMAGVADRVRVNLEATLGPRLVEMMMGRWPNDA